MGNKITEAKVFFPIRYGCDVVAPPSKPLGIATTSQPHLIREKQGMAGNLHLITSLSEEIYLDSWLLFWANLSMESASLSGGYLKKCIH